MRPTGPFVEESFVVRPWARPVIGALSLGLLSVGVYLAPGVIWPTPSHDAAIRAAVTLIPEFDRLGLVCLSVADDGGRTMMLGAWVYTDHADGSTCHGEDPVHEPRPFDPVAAAIVEELRTRSRTAGATIHWAWVDRGADGRITGGTFEFGPCRSYELQPDPDLVYWDDSVETVPLRDGWYVMSWC